MESHFLLIFKYRYNNLIVGQTLELTMNMISPLIFNIQSEKTSKRRPLSMAFPCVFRFLSSEPPKHKEKSFLSKIQNCISEKTKRKIVLLSCKNSVKTQFLGVVEFPSIFLISKRPALFSRNCVRAVYCLKEVL